MENPPHQPSAAKTWLLILIMVGIIAFKGWLAYTVIGDLGQPDWDYRPIKDVPGESPYATLAPYHALPSAQHVLSRHGAEQNPLHLKVIPFEGIE
jgi:hypothetical protein